MIQSIVTFFITTMLFLEFHQISAIDNLHVKYRWKRIDFEYPSEAEKTYRVQNKEYIPENNVPVGIEVYKDRFFVTIPRLKPGVAASLAYFNLTDTSEGPVFHPYPNWDAHKSFSDNPPQIVSPLRIRADRCDRLWVLDSGVDNLWDPDTKEIRKLLKNEVTKPRLLIYDLHNDALLLQYVIPAEQLKNDSLLANIAVEDTDCSDSYAYLADVKRSALIVYSNKNHKSWLVNHHYFHMSPTAGAINVSGISYVTSDGIFALALSAADKEGFSTLYFHPMASFEEFAVSTKVLRNESLATSTENYSLFKHLGSRGPRGQSGVSFLDQKSNVLFYASINLNAVVCWRTTSKDYSMQSQGRIFMNESMMVYPSDIKVDFNNTLWVLSNKLNEYLHSILDYNDYNFRVLSAPVKEAIQNTACASKLVVDPKIMIKVMNVTKGTSTGVRQPKVNTVSGTAGKQYSIFLGVVTFLCTITALLR